jgi:aspartate racemase
MKTVGIIGGIGPESTIEYYRLIIAAYREQTQNKSYPFIIINSIDLQRMRDLVSANELAKVAEYLVEELHKLAQAGADFALIAAGTPHIVFDEVRRQSPLPLLSIVEVTCAEAKALGLKNVGLFGTRYTMQGRFYSDVFSREGIQIIVPDEDEQGYIHDKYFDELVEGIIREETRARLLAIARRMKEQEGIEGLILGGTELSLILHDGLAPDIRFLDTTHIHVRAVIAELFPQSESAKPPAKSI